MEELYHLGLLGLFIGSFLAATILPFSSEALLFLMIKGGYNLQEVLWTASAGNWLGGVSCYYLGFLGNWDLIRKYLKLKPENIDKIKCKIDKYGSLLAWFCWLPVIGDPIAVGLGVVRSNILAVFVYMFLGKLVRYYAIAYLAL